MSEIIFLDPRDLHPMPNQPRTSMDEAKIKGLEETFRSKGFRGAIIIWYPEPDYTEIISGHRSWTAFTRIAKALGYAPPWNRIPCAPFHDISKGKAYELAILYNEKREDLTVIELALSWQRLVEEFNYKPADIAKSFETSTASVYNTISILKEPPYILDYLKKGLLTLPDVLGLRRIKDEKQRKHYADKLVSGDIAKSDLPNIAKRLNRQQLVLDLIPSLKNDLDAEDSGKAPVSRLKIHT